MRTAFHVIAATVIVGLAASVATAVVPSGSRVEGTVEMSKGEPRATFSLKSGRQGGRHQLIVAVVMEYLTGFTGIFGQVGIPASGGGLPTWVEVGLELDAGKGKVNGAETRTSTNYDTRRFEESAPFILRSMRAFFESVNNSTLAVSGKSKAYVPLTSGFTFDRVKIKGAAKVYSGFTLYRGKYTIKATGRTFSGEKVKAAFKLTYKDSPREF